MEKIRLYTLSITLLTLVMLVSSASLVSAIQCTPDQSQNKQAKITVVYGDVGSYNGKGKVVIKNLDTGKTLVTHDLNFAKQHHTQGDKCCVKVYTFDSSGTHNGDRISIKVTGGGGSWVDENYIYKNNLRMSIGLDEIGR